MRLLGELDLLLKETRCCWKHNPNSVKLLFLVFEVNLWNYKSTLELDNKQKTAKISSTKNWYLKAVCKIYKKLCSVFVIFTSKWHVYKCLELSCFQMMAIRDICFVCEIDYSRIQNPENGYQLIYIHATMPLYTFSR